MYISMYIGTKALILNNERDRLKLFIESFAYLYMHMVKSAILWEMAEV